MMAATMTTAAVMMIFAIVAMIVPSVLDVDQQGVVVAVVVVVVSVAVAVVDVPTARGTSAARRNAVYLGVHTVTHLRIFATRGASSGITASAAT